jgi:serine/threonine-protein kinase
VGPGDVLAGKYRVTKVLGVGGMGVVVAAIHIQLEEPVALKFMLPAALENSETLSRFLREARAAVRLRSEHVARVSDVGTLENGAPYIVMEYLDGTDLAGLIASRGPLPLEEAVEFIVHACDALAEAHSIGIVHRDLKPANLFLTHRRDGTPLVKVLDFGISKSSALGEQSSGALTKTGGIMGSPLYMSPEQMRSAKDTDARADVWALGIILHELLSGHTPFETDTLGGLMAMVLTEPPQPLAIARPGLPPSVYDAVAHCLQKDRNARWPSVAHLATALAPFAPARARPIIERIVGVLGRVPAVGTDRVGWMNGPASSVVADAAASRGTTAHGWSDNARSVAGRSSKTARAAVAAAVVLTVAAAGAVVMYGRRASPPLAPAVAESTAVPAHPAETGVPIQGRTAAASEAPPAPVASGGPPARGASEMAPAPESASQPAPQASAAVLPPSKRSAPPPPAPPRKAAVAAAKNESPPPQASGPAAAKPQTGILDTSN